MPMAAIVHQMPQSDRLLTAEDVAHRLNVSTDWVWDHSSRKAPYLPVIPSETALFVIASARSKNLSANENICPSCAANAGKMKEPTLLPPQN